MRERSSFRATAFAGSTFAVALVCGAASVHAAEPLPGVSQAAMSQALPPGCVSRLVDVKRSGYASHYVTSGTYAYGEWRASGYGGQSLWKRSGPAWCKVQTGTSTLDRRALVAYGLSAPVAARLLDAMHGSKELAPPVAPHPHLARRASGVNRVKH